MDVQLKQVTEKDEKIITEILIRSFDSDTKYYFGENAVGGPPGYDDGLLARKIIKAENLTSFMICQDEKKIGCISIDFYRREVAYFCIVSEYHQQGIGTCVWKIIEQMYGSNEWVVETPDYSLKNHAFYEKLGFVKIGETVYSETAKSYVFEKIDRVKLTREKVKKLVKEQPDFMRLLKIIDDLSLQDAWIVAGTVRNYLWNVLSKSNELDVTTDIDVAFYDKDIPYEKNQEIQDELMKKHPDFNWEVKNQVYMHIHNSNTSVYKSSRDAVYQYPEKCTSIALRINKGEIDVFCPYGLEDIEHFVVSPTPYIMNDRERIKLYNERQKMKKWDEKYPRLSILLAKGEK